MSTYRQMRGTEGETVAVRYLVGLGWRVLARNVELGGVEVDILAVDPGPPSSIVVTEVRSVRSERFGGPEEKVDRAKVGRLYRALAELRRSAAITADVAATSVRVDLLAVDLREGREEIRHLRSLEPS